jgi:hypothetical protein
MSHILIQFLGKDNGALCFHSVIALDLNIIIGTINSYNLVEELNSNIDHFLDSGIINQILLLASFIEYSINFIYVKDLFLCESLQSQKTSLEKNNDLLMITELVFIDTMS